VIHAQTLRANELVDGGPVGVVLLDEPEESTLDAVVLDSTNNALSAFDRWLERQRRRNAKELPSACGSHSNAMKNGFYASLRRSHQP
jgi:hypothetical protein